MKIVKAKKSKHEQYVKKLAHKYRVVVSCETWAGHNVPVAHTCHACQTEFRASPRRMLAETKRSPHCLVCSRKVATPEAKVVQKKFEAKLCRKFHNIRLVQWTSLHRNSEFGCLCGAQWVAKPKDVLKDKANPCPECTTVVGATALSAGELEMYLSVRQPALAVKAAVGPQYEAHCGVCDSRWITTQAALLATFQACPTCATAHRLGKSDAHNALDLIVEYAARTTKVNVSTVRSTITTLNQMPQFRYVYKGLGGYYVPYCAVGNELFEVCNKRSIGLEADWELNRVKAKAVARAGATLHMVYVVQDTPHPMPDEWSRWNVEQARAWSRRFELHELRILSMDPGVTNFAWAVLQARRNGEVKVIATGMLRNTLKELTGNSRENTDAFREEIHELLEEYGVSHMIMERFMSRGMKGLTIELVNTMIGILMGMWNGGSDSFKLVTAAQWKNEWNRRSDLKAFYKTVNCEVHQADAIGIGIYGAAYWFDEEPFGSIVQLERKLVKQIAATNIEK